MIDLTRLQHFGAIRIITDEKMVDGAFEDWSQVRSPSRAERRRRRGFKQNIRYYYTPKKEAFVIGDAVIVHPDYYALLKAAVDSQ